MFADGSMSKCFAVIVCDPQESCGWVVKRALHCGRKQANMKHKIRPDDPIEDAIIIALTVALSINAGFMNGCAILSRIEVTVSHMTGNLSHVGLFLLGGDYYQSLVIMYIFLSFFVGAGLSGAMVPEDPVTFGRVFGFMLMFQALAQMASALCGMYLPESYWWWCFAAGAAGVQNATFAKFTGNLIRTTHMTGVINDIAFLVGRLAMGKPVADVWRLRFLVPSVVAFFVGSVLSYPLYANYARASMFFGAGFMFLIGVLYTVYVFFVHQAIPKSPSMRHHQVIEYRPNTYGPPVDTSAVIIHDALNPHDVIIPQDRAFRRNSSVSTTEGSREDYETNGSVGMQMMPINELPV